MQIGIGNIWLPISTFTGIPAGTQVYLQNSGRAGDLIEVLLSDTQPPVEARGVPLRQFDPVYRVSAQPLQIWVRHIRYDLNGTILPTDARKCLLDIRTDTDIAPANIIPNDAYTSNDATKRLKVSSVTRSELQISRGDYFVGSSERLAIPTGNTYYSVIKAPVDKFLVIETVEVSTDFSEAATGQFNVRIDAYVDISNGNTWSYTPSNPVPAGRPLNASVINSVAGSRIDLGVAATLTGNLDYPLLSVDHYLETQGNRESITEAGNNFFDKNRQVIVAPSQEVLIRTMTSGGANGTVDIRTIFFISEINQGSI